MTGREPSGAKARFIKVARPYPWLLRAVGGKFGILLASLVALLLSAPLIVDARGGNLLLGLFASAVLVAGLQAARPGGRSLTIALALAAVDLGIGRLVLIEGGRWLVILQAALWLATLTYVAVTILDAVFSRASVDVETLQAALCVYLLLGLIWVYVYALIALAAPGSFRSLGVSHVAWTEGASRRVEFLRLLVFSYSSLTTTGIGDLTSASGFASICATLEAMMAQVYLAVVVARLIGMQIGPARKEKDDE